MRTTIMAGVIFTAALALAPSGAGAASTSEDILAEIITLEGEVEELEKTYLKAEEQLAPAAVEKKVADGELYFRLGDYQRAAIVFLDIVDRFPNHPAYANALFMLAESMFHASDYYGARARYIEILDHQGDAGFSEYITPSLSRLLEISMHLEQFEGAEKYFGQLDSMSGGAVQAITKYVKAKYYYFKDELDKALQSFQTVKEGEDYYAQSQFFIGVIYTRKQDLQGAIGVFEGLMKMNAETPDQRRILNLARLNLGRLFYQSGQLERAAEAYESVPPTSDLYDQALYEIAMVYIKMGDPTKAERSLEVLSISNPESALIPDAKILRGNLLLRVGKFDEAFGLFKEIGKQFEPVKDELDKIISEHPEPEEYFHELVRTNLETFDAKSFLPPLAISWIKKSPTTERGVQVLNEISLCKDVMEDNDKLVAKMKFVLEGDGKVNAFPLLKAGKARAIQIENRLTQLMKKMLAYQESLMPGSGKGQLQQLQQEMAQLEELVDDLPISPEEFSAREKKSKENFNKLAQALAMMEARVDQLHAKIVATELYIEGTLEAKTGVIPADVKSVQSELEAQKLAIEGYQEEINEVTKMIQLAKSSVGIADENDVKDSKARSKYQALIKEEIDLLKSMGVSAEVTKKLDSMMGRVDAVKSKLDAFNAVVETLAMKKSQEVLAEIDKEVEEMGSQKTELAEVTDESEDVVGFLTLAEFNDVKKSFDDLLVKADVGVIDVAWARKEEHKNRVQYLTTERLQQLQFLDDEFKEILEDLEKKPEEAEGEGE
jgi:tetratricopeptide (TPR) repeat protein